MHLFQVCFISNRSGGLGKGRRTRIHGRSGLQVGKIAFNLLLNLAVTSKAGVAPSDSGGGAVGAFLWASGLAVVVITLVSGAEYVLSGRYRSEGAGS